MTTPDSAQWTKTARRILRLDRLPPLVRRIVVSVAGGALVIVGVIMLVTPGPALLLIPLGLLLLASEFEWSERLIQVGLDLLRRARARFRRGRRPPK